MAKRSVPDQYLAIAALYPKWIRAVAATHRAIDAVREGSGNWEAIRRAKDKLYKLADEAAREAPLTYHDPAVKALIAEIEALPKIDDVEKEGLAAREKMRSAEIKRLREEEREANRPYEWMKR